MREPEGQHFVSPGGWDEHMRQLAEAHAANEPTRTPTTMPCPPGLDAEKWATLDRKTRRELWRHHRRLQRRARR